MCVILSEKNHIPRYPKLFTCQYIEDVIMVCLFKTVKLLKRTTEKNISWGMGYELETFGS